MTSITVLVLISSIFFPWVIVGLYDFSLNEYWISMPVTSIDALPGWGPVKVAGQLNGSSWIVLGYHPAKTKYGYEWRWNNTDVFYLTQGNDSIKVICTEYFDIRDPGHYESLFSYQDGPVYTTLDRVQIIGDIREVGGQKVIILKYMAKEGVPMEHRYIGLVPALLVLPPFICGAAWGWMKLSRWRRWHEEKVRGAAPRDISSEVALMGPGLKWKQNEPGWSNRLTDIAIAVMATIGIVSTIIILYLANLNRDNIYGMTLMIAMIPLFFVIMPICFGSYKNVTPSNYTVSDNGIHLYYDDPEFLLLNERYIGWDEIGQFGKFSHGKSSEWLIIKKNGVRVHIGRLLSEKVLLQMQKQWNDYIK